MSLRARVFIIVGSVILVSNLLFLVWWQNWTVKANKNRQAFVKALADARRAGLPVSAKDLQAPRPPPDQNAAPLYTQMQRLVADPYRLRGDDQVAEFLPAAPTPDQMQATRRALSRRADLMALIHRAAARPYCVFVRNWSDPTTILFQEDKYLEMAARFIMAESRVLDWDGKPLEAVRNQALGFRVARQAYSDKMGIPYLAAEQIDATTLSGLQKILYHDGSNPAVADAVKAVVEKDYRPLSPAGALRNEFYEFLVTLDQLRKGGPVSLIRLSGQPAPQGSTSRSSAYWNNFMDQSGLKLIRRTRRIIDAVDLPFLEAHAVYAAIDTEVEKGRDDTNLVSAILLPLTDMSENRARDTARAEETRAAAAVLVWKARHGTFPETLDIVMNPAPVDPFDGKPLRYRREGAGFVVYSVGKDGKFDGGTSDKKSTTAYLAFHYPMPAYLKTK